MFDIEREIATQPGMWRRAAEIASSGEIPLPHRSERVVALGCGTSWFVAQAFAARREELGQGVTDAFTPTELPAGRSYDRAIVISRSGMTTEVVRVIERLKADGIPVTSVTAVADSPVAAGSDGSIVLDFADERSVVQTRFATTALALLRAHADDLTGAIRDGERTVDEPLPVDPSDRAHFVFLGHGWTVGLAHEAALKLREAAQAWSESYPAMEYRHGPVSLAGPSSLVWILGTPDPTIADGVAFATGATVRVAEVDPMAELILIQRMAVEIAAQRGLDPDHPPHLTRSVLL